jgi:hypothetical protein
LGSDNVTGALMDGKGRRMADAPKRIGSSGLAVFRVFIIALPNLQLSLADRRVFRTL